MREKIIKTSINIPETLFSEAEALARHFDISPNQLIETAIADYIQNAQQHPPQNSSRETKVINQGDVYWVQLADAGGTEPGIPHPHVVVQADVFNHSRIKTVVVCALTSNINRAAIQGNILLESGEADLPRQSVVEPSKISSVDKAQLGDYIGSLTEQRVNQILAALRFLRVSYFER